MVESLLDDLSVGGRTLLKSPALTAAIVATIALAVAATTTIVAVVDQILFRPLPFPDSDRVVALCETNAAAGGWCGASPMNVADWARSAAALDSAGVARTEPFVAQGSGQTYGVMGGIATPGFFHVLRVTPRLGRLIEEPDLARARNHVVLISHAFWQRHAGGDLSIVGRSIVLDAVPFTVIGVLPAGVWMPEPFAEVQVWKPLTASVDNVANRDWRGFTAIGRMRTGVSQATLLSELDVIRARLAAAYPAANAAWGLRIVGLREQTVGDVRSTLWIFLGAAAFLLLVACANVAGLLVVRATGRATEFAVRASLGAGRRRLVQQLTTEHLILAMAGGAIGLPLAIGATAAFVSLAPASTPRLDEVAIDWRVALFGLAMAVVTAATFGLAPARRAWTIDVARTLKGVRGGDRADTRLRSGMAVAQLSLALVLLFGAGLLTRSFVRLLHWEPGFDRANLVTTFMLPPRSTDVVSLMQQARDAVAAMPGIEAVALASGGPLFGGGDTDGIAIEGRPAGAPDQMPTIEWFDIDQHYFETLGIRLVRGRPLRASDSFGAPHVALVNEALARRFFPGEDPIGRRVTVEHHPSEIVGIVADVRPIRPDRPVPPQIYWPIQQFRRGAAYLVIRAAPRIATLETSVEARVASIDPGIELGAFVTLDERVARNLVSPRFNMLLVAFFAGVAVVLSAVGVYGVVACGVASRRREFGVRLALGATPGNLARSVVRRGLVLVSIGLVAGAAGALGLGRVLTTLLHGVPPGDPLTLAGAAAILALAATLACWLPARRASRVDPVAALRAE